MRLLIDQFCAYDSSGAGVLGRDDLAAFVRAELPDAASPGQALVGGGVRKDQINEARTNSMFGRADIDDDGWVDLNEFVHFLLERGRRRASMAPSEFLGPTETVVCGAVFVYALERLIANDTRWLTPSPPPFTIQQSAVPCGY